MTPKQFAPLATLLLAALFAVGCGGGGGEPTVTQTIHDELQAELDAALATLETERAAKARAEEARAAADTARMAADEARATAETERDTAKAAQLAAEAARMEAEAAQAEAEADEAEALAAQLAAEGQLATALDDKAAVEADRDEKRNEATAAAIELIEVKAARDAALDLVTRLTGELEDANSEVTRLTGVIGDETDSADAAATASLHAQLNAAKAEVATLTARVGSETDASSLTGMLEAARADVTRLTGELEDANDEVERLEGVIGDATQPPSLTGRLAAAQAQVTTLQGQLRVSEAEVASLRRQLADARDERDEAEDRAEDAEDRAQQAVQQAGSLEANQRAQGLLDALTGTSLDGRALVDAPPEAEVSVETSNSLKFGPETDRKSSSQRLGFRYAKVTDTFGRTRTTVIYADRELSRKLLDHYGSVRNDEDMTVLDINASPLALPSPILLTSQTWSISHGLSTLTGVDDDNDSNTPTRLPMSAETAKPPQTSYRGSLHGQGGRFVCRGDGCQVQITPDYEDGGGDNGRHALVAVTVAATGGTLHFKPDSGASIGLYEGGPVGTDTEYMVFGYWIEDPESAIGDYAFSPFAEVKLPDSGSASFPASGDARYTGSAVGVYVESAPFGSTDISKRQGEFEAAVSLTATFGGDVGGWIEEFKTTPRRGSPAPRTSNWRVTLADVQTGPMVTGGGATIDGLQSTGMWSAEFVLARTGAASALPPSVVGIFNTSGNSLHLVGAFGAER